MTAPTDTAPQECAEADRPTPGLCTRLAKLAGTAAVLAACNGAPVYPPAAAATVLAFDARSGDWEPAVVADLSPGEELRHDGQLYQVGDTDLVWLGAPTEEALSHADAAFTEVPCHAVPLEDDWVLVLADDDSAAHHARLWEVDDGAQVAFDGRLFLVVDEQPEATGDVLGRVVETFERQAPEVIDAVVQYADGHQDTLTGTPNHPFWVPALRDYVPLGELEVGTALHTRTGGEALLVSKTWRQGDFTVFDVEVQGLHAFYVQGVGGGAPGVLVHNSAAAESGVQANRVAGQVGEDLLAQEFGGINQVAKRTSLGRRVIDNLANGIARESKVGRTSLRSSVRTQIAKDVELMRTKQVNGAEWHFFPGKTGVGPTAPLQRALEEAEIPVVIHGE